jgi:hypothetical protein
MYAAVIAVTLGLIWTPGRWGREDWDYFAHHYEAMRRTVLEYHQIPWWNPWSCGGMPLATNPQLGLVSINFLLVLVFGSYPGLKLATVVHLLIAAEGARWLAGQWMRDPLARALVGFFFVANGAVAINIAAGMLGVLVIAWVPWSIGLALRLEQDARRGIELGGVVALAVLESLHYFVVQLALVLAVIVCWRLWACGRESRSRLLIGVAWAVSIILAVAGMRAALAAELVLDFPRSRSDLIRVHIPAKAMALALIRPFQHLAYRVPHWSGNLGLGWHEFGCYVGVLAVVLFLVSLSSGWRFWHSLAVICLWLTVGNTDWYHPSAWLADVPILGTMRLATRWRVLAVLGLALGCGAVLSQWRLASSKRRRVLATVLMGLLVADLGLNAWPIYAQIFVNKPGEIVRSPDDDDFVQVEKLRVFPDSGTQMLAMLRANYGTVYGYEPLIGQDTNPYSARLWPGHPEYRGEHWSSAGPVEVIRWSPNTIELRAPPGSEVHVNQNPGAYWLAGGRRAFSGLRAMDRHEKFVVPTGPDGRVELSTWPSGWRWGCAISGAGVIGSLCLLISQVVVRLPCSRTACKNLAAFGALL